MSFVNLPGLIPGVASPPPPSRPGLWVAMPPPALDPSLEPVNRLDPPPHVSIPIGEITSESVPPRARLAPAERAPPPGASHGRAGTTGVSATTGRPRGKRAPRGLAGWIPTTETLQERRAATAFRPAEAIIPPGPRESRWWVSTITCTSDKGYPLLAGIKLVKSSRFTAACEREDRRLALSVPPPRPPPEPGPAS